MQRRAIGTGVSVVTDISKRRYEKLVARRDFAREGLASAIWHGGTSQAEMDGLRRRRDIAQRNLDECSPQGTE
jgi:hypothetical protein